jgi:hypothetical protein
MHNCTFVYCDMWQYSTSKCTAVYEEKSWHLCSDHRYTHGRGMVLTQHSKGSAGAHVGPWVHGEGSGGCPLPAFCSGPGTVFKKCLGKIWKITLKVYNSFSGSKENILFKRENPARI